MSIDTNSNLGLRHGSCLPHRVNRFFIHFFLLLLTILELSSPHCYAGGERSGGGDIQCDAKIKGIVSAIRNWIDDRPNGSVVMDFSSSRNPETQKPYTWNEYSSAMIKLLSLPLDSMCVSKGDPKYPVMVGEARKTCKSFVDTNGIHIVCDRELLLGMAGILQGQQLHHEFAIHLPGLEPDDGPISSYKISENLYVVYLLPEKLSRKYHEMSRLQKVCGVLHKRPWASTDGPYSYSWSLTNTNFGFDLKLEPGFPDNWMSGNSRSDLPAVQNNSIPKAPPYSNHYEETYVMLQNFDANLKLRGFGPESPVCITGNLYGSDLPESLAPYLIQADDRHE